MFHKKITILLRCFCAYLFYLTRCIEHTNLLKNFYCFLKKLAQDAAFCAAAMPPPPLPPPVDCFFLQPLPFCAAAMLPPPLPPPVDCFCSRFHLTRPPFHHRHCHLRLIVFFAAASILRLPPCYHRRCHRWLIVSCSCFHFNAATMLPPPLPLPVDFFCSRFHFKAAAMLPPPLR